MKKATTKLFYVQNVCLHTSFSIPFFLLCLERRMFRLKYKFLFFCSSCLQHPMTSCCCVHVHIWRCTAAFMFTFNSSVSTCILWFLSVDGEKRLQGILFSSLVFFVLEFFLCKPWSNSISMKQHEIKCREREKVKESKKVEEVENVFVFNTLKDYVIYSVI